MEETHHAIISLDPDSAPGPDGYSGKFYQVTWEIIKEDVHNMVTDFFRGAKLTKFYTHTCLILLPKVESPNNFSQMRPISLSNFSNKILSKIISNRLTNILPKMISQNQTGFIKGRLITDNVLLTQELVQDIKKNNKHRNIVMKLDMAKAYDKVCWLFLKTVIRKMGFSEIFIDLIHRIIAEVWYSVMINGMRHGFFHSTRGLKQGDPLSPALFVLAAETLFKALNHLHNNERYIGYTMHQKGPFINHLCYADDIVIFSSGNKRTIKMITKVLKQYEKEAGQEINIEKSVFLTASHSPEDRRRMISRITGYKHQFFPMKYLGCPIFPGKKRLSYFADIAKSVMNKAQGWQDFFWGQTENKKRYHWSSWTNMCYPQQERGTGFKSIEDICKVFAAKRWWRIRVEDNLWSQFMMAKYCQRSHVVARKIQGYHSFIWKELWRIKADVEPHIIWRINEAKISFWWDNWTGIGPLALYHHSENNPGTLMVSDCLEGDNWDMDYISKLLPPEICYIIQRVDIGQRNKKDQAIWTANSSGKFTCVNAFQILRKRLSEAPIWKCIWNKGIPLKMAFISWRIIKSKLPMYDRIKNYDDNVDPMCICCAHPKEETIQHVFIEGELAIKIWKYFGDSLGITTQNQSIQARFITLWNFNTKNSMLRVAYQCIPIFICWELWKAWSSWKYGNRKYSVTKIYYEVAQHVSMPIIWSKPSENIIKINTDGSSMAHSNKAGIGGIARDSRGDIIMAFSKTLQFCSNNSAEIQAASFGNSKTSKRSSENGQGPSGKLQNKEGNKKMKDKHKRRLARCKQEKKEGSKHKQRKPQRFERNFLVFLIQGETTLNRGHIKKENELLLNAHKTIEMHRLQIEEEILMRMSYELMSDHAKE
ncbi:uncharacterized protein LOC132629008 [Lycium barbarum]|uniref:uncharacterized protein LOC132629008 n=1 Tax=Lycium barbarum TaxID=112863 RepID=UPI00293E38A0|nr:uncharacterized protein LOC132629008 [Lycium barbarum]